MQVIAPASPQHSTSVLHLSAHGVNGDMLMEDGKATGHLFTGDMLRDMLKRRDEACGSLRLVFLNACSLQAVGQVFVQGGIPHVVCCSITLLDSVSHVFLRTFYNHLFRGSTIINAFGAAIMALKSDPVAETRKAADSFCLLPEEDPHDEVLFSGSKPDIASPWSGDWTGLADAATDTDGSDQSFFPESSSTDGETSRGSPSDGEMVRLLPRDVVRRAPAHRRTFHGREASWRSLDSGRSARDWGDRPRATTDDLPRTRARPVRALTGRRVNTDSMTSSVPQVPEDFLGRSLDVWRVLQTLTTRRAVVLCGAPREDHGVGKSAVLDAVHRAYALQMGGVCVMAHLCSLSEADPIGWICKVQAAVQGELQKYDRRRPGGSSGRRVPKRRSEQKVKTGFHTLTDPIVVRSSLYDDVAELAELVELDRRDWPHGGKLLLILDECDHIIQQPHFQDFIGELLSRTPSSCSMLLSTQQRVVGIAGGRFKLVHCELQRLPERESALLFLKRAHRPLRWEEVEQAGERRGPAKSSDELYRLVAAHPAVVAQGGNPRRIIELASKVDYSLGDLAELCP